MLGKNHLNKNYILRRDVDSSRLWKNNTVETRSFVSLPKENMKKMNTKPYAIEPRCSIDLSLSENPLGCSPAVINMLKKVNLEPSKYPTANGNKLKKVLSQKLGCKTENIFVANGSESIIFTIPKVLAKSNDQAIIPQLTFPLFKFGCEFADVKVKLAPMKKDLGIDLDEVQKSVTTQTKLIFLCNPNNPTGMVLTKKSIITFLNQIPENIITITDEANIDFGGESVIDQALNSKNVLVLRTFSKGFGLANFRVGFAVGDENLIKQMIAQTPPFPISQISEELAIAALSDLKFVEKSKQTMDKEREKIKMELKSLNCAVFDSQANNIFAQLPATFSPELFFQQLKKNNVSIVKGSKFASFDDSFFRLSPKSNEINDKFLQIIKKIVDA